MPAKRSSTRSPARSPRARCIGLSTELEYRLAEKIVASTPAIEQVRFVCSGTEAVMTAARIARAHTGRKLLLKFSGAYHGHSDVLLASPANIGQGKGTKGGTQGISDHLNREIVLCEYNDMAELERLFAAHGDDIAAVLVEPVATNMGLVKPLPGFHQLIRDLCDKHGALFIFDEVVTAFRAQFGGVCTRMGIDPDLVTFGKIIGGGTPVGAYGGKARFMQHVAIGNSVFQSGTFAANPLTMAAGNAALDVLAQPGFYEQAGGARRLAGGGARRAVHRQGHSVPRLALRRARRRRLPQHPGADAVLQGRQDAAVRSVQAGALAPARTAVTSPRRRWRSRFSYRRRTATRTSPVSPKPWPRPSRCTCRKTMKSPIAA